MSRAWIIAGMAWGDESKGATTDKLCREFPVDQVIRHNGGGQAQHNVITPEGIHHTFSQWGAGTLAPTRPRTFLSQHVLVDPITMMREAEALCAKTSDVWRRLSVHPDAVIVTPFHKRLNRLREEARGADPHGSCGMGIGAARELSLRYPDVVLRAVDLKSSAISIRVKLRAMFDRMEPEFRTMMANPWGLYRDTIDEIVEAYARWPAKVDHFHPSECMVFEGAQGVLLDEAHGTAPHTTWTCCTFDNAFEVLAQSSFAGEVTKVGCFRSYFTRHGYGPFPTEDASLLEVFPEPHNAVGRYQGAFRVGYFDFDLASRAVGLCGGVDWLSVSHLDKREALAGRRFLDQIAGIAPIGMVADGPTAEHRILKNVSA